jgi:hypothetical protein
MRQETIFNIEGLVVPDFQESFYSTEAKKCSVALCWKYEYLIFETQQ